MKPHPPKPVDRAAAIACVVTNQLFAPGLGSIVAKRYVVGVGQLFAALVGCGLFTAWFMGIFIKASGVMNDQAIDPNTHNELALAGGAIFMASWVWAGFTSLSVWREAKRRELDELMSPRPPRLNPG